MYSLRRPAIVILIGLAGSYPPQLAAQTGDDGSRQTSLNLLLASPGQAWHTGDYIPGLHGATVIGVSGSTECQNLRFVFRSLQDGAVGPDTTGSILTPVWTGSGCEVKFRWRLGQSPGEQYLSVTVHRVLRTVPADTTITRSVKTETEQQQGVTSKTVVTETVDTTSEFRRSGPAGLGQVLAHDRFKAVAHKAPRVSVGLAYSKAGSTAESAGIADFEPTIGVDFWPALGFLRGTRWYQQNIRLYFATTVDRPGDQVYLGLIFAALLNGARSQASPYQLSLGVRFTPSDSEAGREEDFGFYIAGQFDFSNILTSVLGTLAPSLSGAGVE